jgi:signal transduction histidine kinase
MVSVQTRLVLAAGAVAVVAVVAVAVATRQGVRQEFLKFQDLERRLASPREGVTAARVAPVLDGRCCTPEALREASALLAEDDVVFVLNETGDNVVIRSASPEIQFVQFNVRRSGGVLQIEAMLTRGEQQRRLTLMFQDRGVPIRFADGRQGRVHLITLPREKDADPAAVFLGSLDQRALLATIIVGLLAVAATWTISRRIVGPIQELSGAASDLGTGNLERRVTVRGSGEVAELGRRFNAMAAELERQHTLRRGLLHDVAHELRTPLTALRCRLETLLDGLSRAPESAWRDMRDEVLHLSQLVDDLQELALAEARELRLQVAPVEVAPLVQSALRAAGLDDDPRLRLDLAPGLIAHADAVRTRQVLLNLLTNADRHTPAGDTIVIRAALEPRGPRADRTTPEIVVEVRNTGSPLTDEQLSRVFDRFYRTDPARPRVGGGHGAGTGLGLAIVRSLVEAQGGRVWARSGESEVTVGIALPAAGATG